LKEVASKRLDREVLLGGCYPDSYIGEGIKDIPVNSSTTLKYNIIMSSPHSPTRDNGEHLFSTGGEEFEPTSSHNI
jgi:hypothetical protein